MGAENQRDMNSSLARLASYHYVTCPYPETFSFTKISESGFYYPGKGCEVICAGCGSRVVLNQFNKDSDDAVFHNHVCSFIKTDPSRDSVHLNEDVTEANRPSACHIGNSISSVNDHVPFITETQEPAINNVSPLLKEISRVSTGNQETSQNAHNNTTKSLLQKENQALKQLMTCKACKEAPIQDLFLPCGEMYTCKGCSNKFTHCPSCNKKILGTVTVFFS